MSTPNLSDLIAQIIKDNEELRSVIEDQAKEIVLIHSVMHRQSKELRKLKGESNGTSD